MQRLINFISRSFKTVQDEPDSDVTPLLVIESKPASKHQTSEATRPTYRVSTVKPSEFQKAIDLSG